MSLEKMNKQMKIDINEATSISTKCKLRLVKLVEKHFMVDLPNDNYLNIDIEILENGNIKMRDIEYPTPDPVESIEALEKRFESFQQEANELINKNEVSFDTMTARKERNNLIWILLITFAIAIIAFNAIRMLFQGDYFAVLWIILIIGYYIIPSTGNNIRNRYIRAYHYIKSLIYKKK